MIESTEHHSGATEEVVEETSERPSPSRATGTAAFHLKKTISSGDRAELRRINPNRAFTPALWKLLARHWGAAEGFTALFGLIATLIVIHALHVIGGVVPLAVVTRHAHRGRYDHESHGPVTYVAMYWHFLDAVWVVMFAVLLVAS